MHWVVVKDHSEMMTEKQIVSKGVNPANAVRGDYNVKDRTLKRSFLYCILI